jgi:hypothetical protein
MRGLMRGLLATACFVLVTAIGSGRGETGEAVDLELVLAVDSSLSVDDAEFRIQLDGIAAALRDPGVQAAIVSGELKRIAMALLIWADATAEVDISDWHILDSPESIEAFAQTVERFPRRVSGSTGIGAAVARGIEAILRNDIEGRRRVVDVSGDGYETPRTEPTTVLLPEAHRLAAEAGVTVNGLAIMTEASGLDLWYRDRVITGPDSFMMRARGLEDFPDAMREKLIREISFRLSDASPMDGRSQIASR